MQGNVLSVSSQRLNQLLFRRGKRADMSNHIRKNRGGSTVWQRMEETNKGWKRKRSVNSLWQRIKSEQRATTDDFQDKTQLIQKDIKTIRLITCQTTKALCNSPHSLKDCVESPTEPRAWRSPTLPVAYDNSDMHGKEQRKNNKREGNREPSLCSTNEHGKRGRKGKRLGGLGRQQGLHFLSPNLLWQLFPWEWLETGSCQPERARDRPTEETESSEA